MVCLYGSDDSSFISSQTAASDTCVCCPVRKYSGQKMVSGKDVLYRLEKVKERLEAYTLHELTMVNEGIFRSLEVEKIPAEEKPEVKKNLEAYFDWLVKAKKESAAHFANLYVQQTYPNAVAFIARECQVLTMTLVLYVKSIR